MGSDSEVKVSIVGEVGNFEDAASKAVDSTETIKSHLESLKDTADQTASGMSTLEAAYYSVSSGAQQAAENQELLEAALSSGMDAASGFGDVLKNIGELAAGVFTGLELENLAENLKGFLEDSTLGTFEFAEGLRNLSISSGLTTDQIQELQYAGDIVGVSMNRLQQVVNTTARAMTEFADGSKRVTEAANTLGLDPSKWTSAFDALTQIGEKYKELTASGQQLSLANEAAFQVFLGGRFGMQSLAALERLPELEEQARAAGVIMGSDTVAASDKAAEAIHTLSAEWTALEHAIGGALAPAATLAAQGFGERVLGLQPPEAGGVAGGSKDTGEMQAETLQPVTQTSAQLKASFEQNVTDFEASQKEIMAAAGDTAKSRIAYEKNVHDFLVSQEQAAAAVGIDLSKQIAGASVAEASARTAAMKEMFAEFKQLGEANQADIREKAKEQMDALDAMYTDFKDLGTEVLDHVKEKWGELDSAEQQTIQDLKDRSAEIGSVLEPIASAFGASFDAIIAGTQKTSVAFEKMGESILLETAKSGIHDLLLGGKANTIGADIFGTTGQGGGLAGGLAKAFEDSTVGTAIKKSLSTAFTGIETELTTVFGAVFNGLKSVFTSLFGGAAQGAGGAAASAAGSASTSAIGGAVAQSPEVIALTAIEATLTSELSLILGTLVSANVALDAMGVSLAYLALPKVTETVSAAPFGVGSLTGITAAGGAIVPDDVLGGGGMLSILHPREMVLPASISEFVQRAAASSSTDGMGGGDTHVHMGDFHVHAIDSNSFKGELAKHAEFLAHTVSKEIRRSNNTMIHQMGKK